MSADLDLDAIARTILDRLDLVTDSRIAREVYAELGLECSEFPTVWVMPTDSPASLAEAVAGPLLAEVARLRQLLAAAIDVAAADDAFIHMERGSGPYVESLDIQRLRAGELPRDTE